MVCLRAIRSGMGACAGAAHLGMSGLGACAGAARCCIHFPPALQEPPSGHPPGRCLAHPHLLEMPINHETQRRPIGLHSQNSLTKRLVSRISVRKSSHMSIQPQLMLTDYRGNKSHLCLSQQLLVGHSLTSDSQGFSEETWYRGS